MGGASSKVARRLPTRPQPTWAGARAEAAPQSAARQALASETKDKAIEMDARDPDFMQKLNQLGPVKVDHHMSTYRTDMHMKNMLHSRDVSEQQASSSRPTQNRILAGALYQLLEDRKTATSSADLARIAKTYDVDVGVLERLAQTVNSPTVAEETRRVVAGEGGEERMTVMAKWVENKSLAT